LSGPAIYGNSSDHFSCCQLRDQFRAGAALRALSRQKTQKAAQEREALALRNRPPEPEALNKAKRKRQLQQLEKEEGKSRKR
jgi:hypothetical protein